MPTAHVTLHVDSFVPGGRCAFARPVINDSAGTRLQFKNPEIGADTAMKAVGHEGNPLDISFTIPGYAPQGIAFNPVRPRDGIATFDNVRINGSTITVTDLFLDAGRGDDMGAWDYTITVVPMADQRAKPGTIDPEIDNETDLNQGT
jgi:hypothetical protein